MSDSNKELVKKKQEEKLRFEIEYVGSTILSALSYLDLADDDRTVHLYSKLDSAYSEIKNLLKDKLEQV